MARLRIGETAAMRTGVCMETDMLNELMLMNEKLSTLIEQYTALNESLYSILIEVEIIAMSIIVIWLLSWIRRVTRKGRKTYD